MFKNLSIKFRLIFVIAFLSSGLLAIGMFGLVGVSQTNEGLREVYENRAIPLGQMKHIESGLLEVQAWPAHDLREQLSLLLDNAPNYNYIVGWLDSRRLLERDPVSNEPGGKRSVPS